MLRLRDFNSVLAAEEKRATGGDAAAGNVTSIAATHTHTCIGDEQGTTLANQGADRTGKQVTT